MRTLRIVTLTATAALALAAMANIALALGYSGWSAIGTGYAITSNWQGIEVPIGQNVVATAGTTDLTITTIIFRWHDPADNVMWEDTVPVSGPITTPTTPSNVPNDVTDWANDNPDTQYLYAQSAHMPSTIGDWGVQAFFIGPYGKTKAGLEDVVQIRAASFNVIPELPIIGTAGITIAMLLGLGLFSAKRKRKA
jgi:hypothetical protein